ncbi:MAG: hypothetical protein RQ826_08440 [Xanthomonadales bacterium]|nr:hypothetical protein [Xanthomonadales bacterium]
MMNLQILLRIFFALWKKGAAAAGLPLWSLVEQLLSGYRRVLCIYRVPIERVLTQTAAF